MKNSRHICLLFLALLFMGAGSEAFANSGGPQAGMGNACKFDAGPRSGQTQDYSHLQPLPVGSPCQDGQGSTGKVVVLGGTSVGSSAGSTSRGSTISSGPSPAVTPPASGKSKKCLVLAGADAGSKEDFFVALPIGVPCLTPKGVGVIVR